MRCRECGLELDERDRLRNGAYQCPECGTINHTAQSSRVSPSPWRRKRRSNFAPAGGALSQRFAGLPVWSWIAIVLAVVVIAVILVLTLGGRGKDATTPANDMPATQDVPVAEATVDPNAALDPSASQLPADEEQLLTGLEEAATASTLNTGVAKNDFVVSFDWAMSYLNFTSSLTQGSSEPGAGGATVEHYTYDNWFDLSLTLAPDTNLIRSATAVARIPAGSTDNIPVLAAFVSTIYSFDNSINAGAARTAVEGMIADNSHTYEANGFSGVLSGDATNGYTMQFTGKLE